MIHYAFEKIGMTHYFADSGEAYGVTILKLKSSKIVRHEVLADARKQIIVEFETGYRKNISRGFFVDSFDQYPIGSSLACPAYKTGEKLSITGISKGKGFQDVVTRYGFGGGPASHGSRFHRSPGSVGMRTEPGRTPRGKKMPGRDGDNRVTLKNMEVAQWVSDESLLAVIGGVPGSCGNLLFI